MKKLRILYTVLVASMCVVQSCKKDDPEVFQMGNQEFISYASSSNHLEIQAGELSKTRGQSDTIKAFGVQTITDHTAAEARLADFAARKGLGMAQNFLSHHAGNLNILNQVTPSSFDRRFAELMVITDQELVNLFRLASQPNGVPDAEIRSWAASELPALELDLSESQAMYILTGP
jgi:putative membrane protein